MAAAVLELVLGPLRENPYRVGKPLREPFDGVWSARRATYRVLYRIDEERRTVLIEAIKHRGDAYR
ncbi:type II toxin-antitoxin system RelE/ParE family toxin [Allokutzneria sp. NRRL B-24872]|uniref:type II toxin-antitoxin system RelE family toxin n=1 Tax=Allokutzneria sp. NRRL B-24872 TaxID=1137961 RepID=UPI001FF00FF4|nr:type II toxin-antitoxin system RelE/ParE family toxin [Allokutzneria sp. NRRL B-24872]